MEPVQLARRVTQMLESEIGRPMTPAEALKYTEDFYAEIDAEIEGIRMGLNDDIKSAEEADGE